VDSNQISKKELQKFGIILGCILCIIAGLQFLKGRNGLALWLGGIAGAVLFAAIFFTDSIKPLYWILSRIGRMIGWVNTKLLLVIIFYIFCTPVGLLRKIFYGDPLDRKIEKEKSTYWVNKIEDSDFTKQY